MKFSKTEAAEALEVLEPARRLLAGGDKWGKGFGLKPPGDDRFCLLTATQEAAGRALDRIHPALRAIRKHMPGKFMLIDAFNDDPATKHGDILNVLDQSIAWARKIAQTETPK